MMVQRKRNWTGHHPRVWGAVALAALVAMSIVLGTATAAVSPPSGATALAMSAKVEVSWQPGAGAASYQVLRGTSAATITTVVASNVVGTTFADSTVSNNTTYYYRVRATGDTQLSNITSAVPRAVTCTTGNTIAKENCFPGSTAWKVTNREQAVNGGIEGYATSTSVNPGGSLDLKINADTGAPYHVDIYRSGYYGGTQGRLMGSIRGLTGMPAAGLHEYVRHRPDRLRRLVHLGDRHDVGLVADGRLPREARA